MVRDVLRLPRSYAYYAYAGIARRRVELRAPLPLAEAWLIYRLMVEFAPGRVLIVARGAARDLIADIAALVGATTAPRAEDADMVVALDPPGAAAAPMSGYYAYGALADVPATLPCGHVYRNRRRAVAALRPGVPFQRFDIAF